jgi:hypothetical protein
MSDIATDPTASRSKIDTNINKKTRKAIVIRSHHVDNGATVGLASNFFEETGALKGWVQNVTYS